MIYLVYDSDITNLLDVVELSKEQKTLFEKKNKDKKLVKADEIDFSDYINTLEDIFEE
jgi:hypothetical protein